MRHIVGFLAGLVLAAVVVLSAGWALPRLTELNEAGGTLASTSGATTIAALCVLALALGLALVPPRLTPMLPGITGLSLAGLTAIAHLRPDLVDTVPNVPGVTGAVTLLTLGLYIPVGLALVVPLFSPTRWRRKSAEDTISERDYFDGLYDEDYESDAASTVAAPRGGHHRA